MKHNGKPSARRFSGQTVFLAVVVVGSCVVLGYVLLSGNGGANGNTEAAVSRLRLEDIPFDGARAYGYLEELCEIGPRRSGSEGMARQQEFLTEHFQKLGGAVELQRFRVAHPIDRSPVSLANLIVRWHPQSKQRILLCTHYDTLPFPLEDPVNRRGRFVGANDGGSGVAVLMELAHEMRGLKSNYGVDFVFFDGEEFIFDRNGRYFLGSEFFARQYVKNRPAYRYRWGVLLDMIGDKDLRIPMERHSVGWKDTQPLVKDIWSTAARLGVREFVSRRGQLVRDDHLPLHNLGKIPCCNLIDFDYPPWHTQGDTPDKCSALSLAKVGWVVHEWLKAVR